MREACNVRRLSYGGWGIRGNRVDHIVEHRITGSGNRCSRISDCINLNVSDIVPYQGADGSRLVNGAGSCHLQIENDLIRSTREGQQNDLRRGAVDRFDFRFTQVGRIQNGLRLGGGDRRAFSRDVGGVVADFGSCTGNRGCIISDAVVCTGHAMVNEAIDDVSLNNSHRTRAHSQVFDGVVLAKGQGDHLIGGIGDRSNRGNAAVLSIHDDLGLCNERITQSIDIVRIVEDR